MAKRTIEEKFLLQVFELAKSKNDPRSEVSIVAVALKAKITEKQCANIIKVLKRTGFLKQYEEETICLTPKAIELVEELSS